MHGEKSPGEPVGDVAVSDVPPMRDLAFSMLSLLIDAAAAHLRVEASAAAAPARPPRASESSMREARAAIDAANAMLGAVRDVLEMDAVRAVEGMLTQLQLEYVHRAGRLA